MRLISIDYAQHEGQPKEWTLKGLTLGPVNLLVGKNASGKTRALNVINGLARLLSGDTKLNFMSGNYHTVFEDGGKEFTYVLQYEDAKVAHERFTAADRTLLERREGGVGKIFAEKEQKDIDFQTPENELAAVTRRDTIQHPFFEPLNQWAGSVYHYAFGSDMGKDLFAVFAKSGTVEFNPRDTKHVVGAFKKGEKAFGDAFKESIKDDMRSIGYELEEVGIQRPTSIRVEGPLSADLVCLYVRETDLKDVTDQIDMSQGMFRALSVIVHLNYSQMASSPGCIIIDDIGEGLDFERSCALIELLIRKTERSSVQLIMATNDRFVMNKVPLEAWSLLQRDGGVCRVRNYANSREIFDEFKFTGMSNFDFFAVDYVSEGQHVNE
jgi:energy-coupling factor transporter ATP-binding protein EcfA2